MGPLMVPQHRKSPGVSGESTHLARGEAIGRYVVLSLVGKGAMGEVYAAYDPELDRKVAIKLLRVQGDQTDVSDARARLIREAQAIAKVSHPNVVVVYDVGTFQERVFMAMEFVEGLTVSYWMHAAPRTWSDILEVFVQAGRGLAAAHEKDVVHRDFKPDNVMRGTDGKVRVMDFGLARVVMGSEPAGAGTGPSDTVGPSAGPAVPLRVASEAGPAEGGDSETDYEVDVDSTRAFSSTGRSRAQSPGRSNSSQRIQLTQTGEMLGTPAYMSPEQFKGGSTDARTDQFSFCVALHEALYGQRPFAGTNFTALIESVTKGIVREAPVPSDVPSWLREIVLRGLSVEPGERWPSMPAMLAELDNYEEMGLRRRFDVGAKAKLAGVWVAPLSGDQAESAVRAQVRRSFVATGRRYAEVAFENASGILDRYAESWAAMYVDACAATHVRGEQSSEVLDLRMASLQEALDGLKALVRVFQNANAEVVENAVGAAKALPSIDRCADVKALRALVKPPDSPEVREVVEALRAKVAEVRVACNVGRLTEAMHAIGPLEDEARSTGYGPVLAEILLEHGKLHSERRSSAAAATCLEEAVWTAELARHDEVAAEAATTLIHVVGDTQSRIDAGEIWARHAEMVLRRLGGHDQLWGWLYNNRGAMRIRQGRLADALEDQKRAVEAKEKVGGPYDPDVACSLANIALILEQMGEPADAALYDERALRILDATLGPYHPRTAIVTSNYSEVLNLLGRFEAARDMAWRALEAIEGEVGSTGLFVTFPLTALALANLGAGCAEEALPLLERAVTIRDALDAEPLLAGEVHFALARALVQLGRDATRAVSLATQARQEYARAPAIPAAARSLAQIDAWMASHLDAGSASLLSSSDGA